MGIKRIEKIGNEDIRATASVANISEKIREVRLIMVRPSLLWRKRLKKT